MSNVLTIAQKELNSYFASPIAYIIIGFFALVFGWFYFVSINFFMRLPRRRDTTGMVTSLNGLPSMKARRAAASWASRGPPCAIEAAITAPMLDPPTQSIGICASVNAR